MTNQHYINGMGIHCEECGQIVFSSADWMQHMEAAHVGTTLDDWEFQMPVIDGIVYPLDMVASGRLCTAYAPR